MQFPPVELLTGFLWLGSVRDASNLHWLREKSIKHVINCGSTAGEANPKDPSRYYYTIHALDAPGYPIMDNHFLHVANMLFQARQRGEPVLINCHQGINRSTTLAVAFVALISNTPVQELIQSIRRQRPVLQNQSFVNQLLLWDSRRRR